jgi:hypothetical protein
MGGIIDIDQYIGFIEQYKEFINVYANLDVIGDDEGTWRNQKYMEDKGYSPLPVYHIGDKIEYLYKCLEYPYFCLGGISKSIGDSRVKFLDKCWDIICDTPDRLPKCKVHGFGMTGLEMMIRYPWFSVDSTSWLTAGRFGGVLIPKRGDYTKRPWKISVSTRSPDRSDEGAHFDTLSTMEKDVVLKYFKENGLELGVSQFKYVPTNYILQENERWCDEEVQCINASENSTDKVIEIIIQEGLCNSHILRDCANFIYYRDLEKSFPLWPWPFVVKKKFGLGLK